MNMIDLGDVKQLRILSKQFAEVRERECVCVCVYLGEGWGERWKARVDVGV